MKATLCLVAFGDSDSTARAVLGGVKSLGDVCRRVVVVDNRPELPFRPPVCSVPLVVISSDDNVGFARAANRAAECADTASIVFLNPDTDISDSSLRLLVEILQDHADVGCVGPIVKAADGSIRGAGGWFHTSPYRILRRLGLGGQGIEKSDGGPLIDVDWVAGTCLAVRRDAFLALAGFDETYHMYFEDVDLCWRLRKAGWRRCILPRAAILHHGGEGYRHLPVATRENDYRRSRNIFLRRRGGVHFWLMAQFLDLLVHGRYHRQS